MTTTKPGNVEEYISGFSNDIQKMLKQIRMAVKKAAPQAEELISYNMPLYKWNGMLVSFAAWKTHIGLYPAPSAGGGFRKKLIPYEGAKATMRFAIDKPLPLTLITKIIKLRMEENLKRVKAKVKRKN